MSNHQSAITAAESAAEVQSLLALVSRACLCDSGDPVQLNAVEQQGIYSVLQTAQHRLMDIENILTKAPFNGTCEASVAA